MELCYCISGTFFQLMLLCFACCTAQLWVTVVKWQCVLVKTRFEGMLLHHSRKHSGYLLRTQVEHRCILNKKRSFSSVWVSSWSANRWNDFCCLNERGFTDEPSPPLFSSLFLSSHFHFFFISFSPLCDSQTIVLTVRLVGQPEILRAITHLVSHSARLCGVSTWASSPGAPVTPPPVSLNTTQLCF